MPSLFVRDQKARQSLLRGMDKAASVLIPTLGPYGGITVTTAAGGDPVATQCSREIVKSLVLEDPFEQMGARLLREAVEHTLELAGDGGTTTALMTKVLATDICRCTAAGMEPIFIADGITHGIQAAHEMLYRLARPADSEKLLGTVAAAAAHDPEIGLLIASVLEGVEQDAAVLVEVSTRPGCTVERSGGMTLERGFFSSQLTADHSGGAHTARDVRVLITDQVITSARSLLPVVELMQHLESPLLLLADDFTPEAMKFLTTNQRAGLLHCTAVQAPDFGTRKQELLQDAAALTGAELISPVLGLELCNIQERDLGTAWEVRVDAEQTTILVRECLPSAQQRLDMLRRQLEETDFAEGRQRITQRISNLSGGTIRLLVGGHTMTEAKEKQLRTEHGLRAAQSARKFGVVAGAGVTGLELSARIRAQGDVSAPDVHAGIQAVAAALAAPYRLLFRSSESGENLFRHREPPVLWEPVQVLDIALRSAGSIARLLLSSECLVSETEEVEPGFYQKFKTVDLYGLHQKYGRGGEHSALRK